MKRKRTPVFWMDSKTSPVTKNHIDYTLRWWKDILDGKVPDTTGRYIGQIPEPQRVALDKLYHAALVLKRIYDGEMPPKEELAVVQEDLAEVRKRMKA